MSERIFRPYQYFLDNRWVQVKIFLEMYVMIVVTLLFVDFLAYIILRDLKFSIIVALTGPILFALVMIAMKPIAFYSIKANSKNFMWTIRMTEGRITYSDEEGIIDLIEKSEIKEKPFGATLLIVHNQKGDLYFSRDFLTDEDVERIQRYSDLKIALKRNQAILLSALRESQRNSTTNRYSRL